MDIWKMLKQTFSSTFSLNYKNCTIFYMSKYLNILNDVIWVTTLVYVQMYIRLWYFNTGFGKNQVMFYGYFKILGPIIKCTITTLKQQISKIKINKALKYIRRWLLPIHTKIKLLCTKWPKNVTFQNTLNFLGPFQYM